MKSNGEFSLIERIATRASVTCREDVVFGIGDDCALMRAPLGQLIATTTDTLNVDVHFFPGIDPFRLGQRALAVNLSDLAAMGAEPSWVCLALTLPDADPLWLDAFIDGFITLAASHNVQLVGGNMSRGPLSIGVTVSGFVSPDDVMRRDRATLGQTLYLGREVGSAALALKRRLAGRSVASACLDAFECPVPQVGLGVALRGVATACIDVSDGLVQDLRHMLKASGVSARINLEAIPCLSDCVADWDSPEERLGLALTGGEDYCLLFSASLEAVAAANLPNKVFPIGVVTEQTDELIHFDQSPDLSPEFMKSLSRPGHDHFS